VAANLAFSLARLADTRVLLVELDLRHPSLMPCWALDVEQNFRRPCWPAEDRLQPYPPHRGRTLPSR
jgi:Mrp family chromosome partitioning ATPase